MCSVVYSSPRTISLFGLRAVRWSDGQGRLERKQFKARGVTREVLSTVEY
jgi:hypothetical protein